MAEKFVSPEKIAMELGRPISGGRMTIEEQARRVAASTASPNEGRLKKQLIVTQQKLVERDFEIAGMKTYIQELLAEIVELKA